MIFTAYGNYPWFISELSTLKQNFIKSNKTYRLNKTETYLKN